VKTRLSALTGSSSLTIDLTILQFRDTIAYTRDVLEVLHKKKKRREGRRKKDATFSDRTFIIDVSMGAHYGKTVHYGEREIV